MAQTDIDEPCSKAGLWVRIEDGRLGEVSGVCQVE
jgi:hypothetical protein